MIACNLEISYRPLGKLKEKHISTNEKNSNNCHIYCIMLVLFFLLSYFNETKTHFIVIFIGEIIRGGSVYFKHIQYYD